MLLLLPRIYNRAARSHSLGAAKWLFVAGAVLPTSAFAQTASTRALTTSKTTVSPHPTAKVAVSQPQLTLGWQPQSVITSSAHVVDVARKPKGRTALVMSLPSSPLKTLLVARAAPAAAPAAAPVVVAAPSATAGTATTLAVNDSRLRIAQRPEKPVRRRVEVLAPANERGDLTSITAVAPIPTAVADSFLMLPPAETSVTRGTGAQLPSRGGLNFNKKPIELRPETSFRDVPPSSAVSESQRLLLARLDADLGRAQKRLSRAESRLSEGQKQLGAFTGVLQSVMLEAGDDARGLHPFVRVAQRYLGTPYLWGGESARGFDCSGFIMRVMRDLGYRALPHSAAEQFRYGLPIAKPLLKAGDIVFFANTYKPGISHVGIYLGRGRFIHAANSKVGTIVSGLNESKWVEKYAGARRLLPVKS